MEITDTMRKVYDALIDAGVTKTGAFGVLANLYAESGVRADNLENGYEGEYTDASYTKAVDDGSYSEEKFAYDGFGYGIAQWSYFSRKKGLWRSTVGKGMSISSVDGQVSWLLQELRGMADLWSTLTSSDTDAYTCVREMMLDFERPADQSDENVQRRYNICKEIMAAFGEEEEEAGDQSLRDRCVEIAQGWLGAKKGDNVHKEIIDIYNSHRPLARGYKMRYTDDWCAAFVSAVVIQAGAADYYPLEVGCGKMIDKAKSMGIWIEEDHYIPAPCDWVIYNWDDNGAGELTWGADHVGIVESVHATFFDVIEGNMGGESIVGRRHVIINGKYIRGFISPKLSPVPAPDPTPSPSPTPDPTPDPSPTDEIYIVQPGDTLSGIADHYGVSWRELAEINQLDDPNLIFVGQRIKIRSTAPTPSPTEEVYIVQPGDTLSGIAEKYNTSWRELAEINDLDDPNLIFIGQKIRIK